MQCYIIHTVTILLLLKLNEPNEKEITTVQSSILGCWAKDELEFYWQATYKKTWIYTTKYLNEIPNAQTILKHTRWYLLGHTLLYLGGKKNV